MDTPAGTRKTPYYWQTCIFILLVYMKSQCSFALLFINCTSSLRHFSTISSLGRQKVWRYTLYSNHAVRVKNKDNSPSTNFGPVMRTGSSDHVLSVVRPSSLTFHIFDFFFVTAEQNSTIPDRKQDPSVLYQVCVLGPIEKPKWPPWPLIGQDTFDLSSITTEMMLTEIERKQVLNVLYQICVFLANLTTNKDAHHCFVVSACLFDCLCTCCRRQPPIRDDVQ